VPGRTFEQFRVGERFEHGSVAVTMADNEAFCRLTRNAQPLHLDPAAAHAAGLPAPLVNGLYTMSLAVGLSVPDTTAGTLVGNLGYEKVEHPLPVFPGDTLHFATEVLDKRASSKPGRGIVTLGHRATNQKGDVVCRFRRIVMVRSEGA
jgi:acyl dehydratase